MDVSDDDPPGGSFGDDGQLRGAERTGAAFSLNIGALFIADLRYAIGAAGNGVADRHGSLPETYRIGAWFDSGAFPDRRFDDQGLSLADSASNEQAEQRRHNYGIYFSRGQQLWIDHAGARSVGVFARLTAAIFSASVPTPASSSRPPSHRAADNVP